MKLTFSTKNVTRASFIDTCRYAYDYGYSGFEIYDAINERKQHYDSILRSERTADSKRKLVNRALEVSALVYPYALEETEATSETLLKYVDMARNAGIERIIVRNEKKVSNEVLKNKLSLAIERAEKSDIQILFESF